MLIILLMGSYYRPHNDSIMKIMKYFENFEIIIYIFDKLLQINNNWFLKYLGSNNWLWKQLYFSD